MDVFRIRRVAPVLEVGKVSDKSRVRKVVVCCQVVEVGGIGKRLYELLIIKGLVGCIWGI